MQTVTTAATVSAKVLANRAARREAEQGKKHVRILAKVVSNTFAVTADENFTTDIYGRKVRVTKPTDQEISHTLRGNRVLDSIELNEQLGPDTITKLISNGSLRRDANHSRKSTCNLYWVTDKARELYDLPARIRLCTGIEVDYVPAEFVAA